jgi:hypothetical protein
MSQTATDDAHRLDERLREYITRSNRRPPSTPSPDQSAVIIPFPIQHQRKTITDIFASVECAPIGSVAIWLEHDICDYCCHLENIGVDLERVKVEGIALRKALGISLTDAVGDGA